MNLFLNNPAGHEVGNRLHIDHRCSLLKLVMSAWGSLCFYVYLKIL